MEKNLDPATTGLIASNPRIIDLFKNIIYIKNLTSYYHKELKTLYKVNDICDFFILKRKNVEDFRINWLIDEYNSIIISEENIQWCYNLFSRDLLLPIWENNILDKNISFLLNKISWWDENKEYLEKLILYKYYHPTDYTIPALILHWNWWIGKWQFCKMLWNIFWWPEYCALWLWQEALTGSFSYYKWDKLIVEFSEIYSHDTHQDKIVMNKLKNIIWQSKITVNEKFKIPYVINNPALFIITSNYEKPVHFDAWTWNRRFSVIKSIEPKMTVKEWYNVNNAINDTEILKNFLCYLDNKWWDVIRPLKWIRSLENEDKKALTQASMSDAQRFWKRLSDNHYDDKILWKDLIEWPTNWFWVTDDSFYIKNFIKDNPDIDNYQLKKWLSKECPFPKKSIRSEWKIWYWIYVNRKFEE